MPFIPALDCARVTLHQELHGEAISNTFYVRQTGGFGEEDLAEVALLVRDWAFSNLSQDLSVNWSLRRIVARAMSVEEAPGIEYVTDLPVLGGIQSQAAPGNVALAIKLKSGLTGRNRSGRVFQGGISEDDTEGNVIEASRGTALTDDWEALRASLATNSVPMVIASFYDGTELVALPNGETRKRPIPRATALITPVVSVSADNQFDSMKRRLAGRGR